MSKSQLTNARIGTPDQEKIGCVGSTGTIISRHVLAPTDRDINAAASKPISGWEALEPVESSGEDQHIQLSDRAILSLNSIVFDRHDLINMQRHVVSLECRIVHVREHSTSRCNIILRRQLAS